MPFLIFIDQCLNCEIKSFTFPESCITIRDIWRMYESSRSLYTTVSIKHIQKYRGFVACFCEGAMINAVHCFIKFIYQLFVRCQSTLLSKLSVIRQERR